MYVSKQVLAGESTVTIFLDFVEYTSLFAPIRGARRGDRFTDGRRNPDTWYPWTSTILIFRRVGSSTLAAAQFPFAQFLCEYLSC